VEGFKEQLANHVVVGLDTSVFIYHFEAHPRYLPLTQELLASIQAGQRTAIASTIMVMELTVQPWKMGRSSVAREYEALLIHFPNLALVDVNRDVARRAALVRADHSVRPADALHIATALLEGATAFVTNDRKLSRLSPEISIIVLDDFASP
jgi:predicted nucleic acid-binding protein